MNITHVDMKCRICSNTTGNVLHIAKEIVFGLDGEFQYIECVNCGCVQIAEFPRDIKRYYPYEYPCYALQNFTSSFLKYLRQARNSYALYNKGIVGRIMYKLHPLEAMYALRSVKPKKHWRILDVGCGKGSLLYFLTDLGFGHCFGIDPFIDQDLHYSNGLFIAKKYIFEVDGKWDFIMFQHSFEHIAEQNETLEKVKALLEKDGICMIRIPLTGSYAWEKYGIQWVQFDAPRHFFLHSLKSFSLLVDQNELKIEKIIYDSSAYQFWGSEQVKKKIYLCSPDSYFYKSKKSIFTKKEIMEFNRKTKDLNQSGKSDQAVFILRAI